MTRSFVAPVLLATLLAVSAAQAQAPGQIPGTLYPAPAVIPPPPPVAPAPVPSAVTPLPSPTYGVPRGVTAPVFVRRHEHDPHEAAAETQDQAASPHQRSPLEQPACLL